jgi:DNA-binding XRE family transcriptional regulator
MLVGSFSFDTIPMPNKQDFAMLDEINADIFGRQLHYFRIKSGFTVRQLAREADVPAYAIEQYERGFRAPIQSTAERLAKALGLRLKDLSSS